MNVENVNINRLHPFEGNPFRINTDDERMRDLVDSIREQGIYFPLAVMKRTDGDYEIICGHRRLEAAKMAGLYEVPVMVLELTRDEAVIMLVDDNLTKRAEILPSEKAFAYKMKLEALRHQGERTSGQVGRKWSRDEISDTESGRTVQRYIRLTNLHPDLLKLVDEKRIAMTPAVELSYLTKEEQKIVAEYYAEEDVTPSYSQAIRMKKLSLIEALDAETIWTILSEVKGNQVEYIKVPAEVFRAHTRRSMTDREAMQYIEKALDYYKRHLDRKYER